MTGTLGTGLLSAKRSYCCEFHCFSNFTACSSHYAKRPTRSRLTPERNQIDARENGRSATQLRSLPLVHCSTTWIFVDCAARRNVWSGFAMSISKDREPGHLVLRWSWAILRPPGHAGKGQHGTVRALRWGFIARRRAASPDYACFGQFARVVTSQRKARATVPTATSTATNARINVRVASALTSQLYIVSPVE